MQRVSGLRCTSLLRASPQQLFSLALCHFLVNGHFASTLPYLINALKKMRAKRATGSTLKRFREIGVGKVGIVPPLKLEEKS